MANFSKHPTAKICDLRSAISPPKIIQNLLPFVSLLSTFPVAFQILGSVFGQQLLFKRKHRCVSPFHLYRDYEPVSHRFYQRLMPF